MTEFSKVFEKYIEEKKIQLPALGKYCGMDYKEIFRILKGKGELPDEDILQKIMSYMQLTPSEKRNILKVYEITRIGKEKYYMHRQVQTLLEEFPEYFYADRKSDILKISTEPPNENNRNCIPLFNQTEINQYLHYICIREARKQKNSRICLIMQPDHKFAMELLQSLKTINEDLVIEHVISIDKTEKMSENVEFYNLRYLKNLLPLYINAMNYNVYCMEGNLQSYGEELPGFSNIFLTEDYVLVCTADFGRGILYNSPETKEYFRKRYNSFRDQSRELFHVVANVQNQMESLGDMGQKTQLCNPAGTLSAQPYATGAYRGSSIPKTSRKSISASAFSGIYRKCTYQNPERTQLFLLYKRRAGSFCKRGKTAGSTRRSLQTFFTGRKNSPYEQSPAAVQKRLFPIFEMSAGSSDCQSSSVCE